MATIAEVPLPQPAHPQPILTPLQSKQPSIAIISVPTNDILPANTLVLDPALITQDFDLLRFEAAAFGQLPKASTDGTKNDKITYSTSLISSPYNNPGHYLLLPTLPLPSLLFAKALTALAPTSPSYATLPYAQALNFPRVINVLRNLVQQEGASFAWPETTFHVVVFRSELKPDIDNEWLYKLDYESHREACESGGLLKYWFGKSDDERKNLATCFWHSRADAQAGGLGPWHKKARAAGRELYEHIAFSTWRFVITSGVREWRVEEVTEHKPLRE
ncbi:hypothetical protein CC86DRAFT_293700 [Ophiobolus disseminans]|uniref:Uncharacterized protein n=1 Tax=Ophiobolus disseminans TaxID=1469910 RepID=A0A6A7A012_9PLEO|nr:hypothetical protein CC86DRAFT_293700 [Ophiobolus disseminans]